MVKRKYVFKGHHIESPKVKVESSRRDLAINKTKDILAKKHKYYANRTYINAYLKLSKKKK